MRVALGLAGVDRGGVDRRVYGDGKIVTRRQLHPSVEGGETAADLRNHQVANHKLQGRVGGVERVGALFLHLGSHF